MFGAEVYELRAEVVEVFSSLFTSAVYTMKLHLLDYLMKDMRNFGDISFLDASFYEKFDNHISNAYARSSKR